MSEISILCEGLRFPEGPVWLGDGSLLVTELARGTLTRIDTGTGEITQVIEVGPGPNGAALGPDGKVYVADNGGYFDFIESGGLLLPQAGSGRHEGGSIRRVDLDSEEVEVLYQACAGESLVAPNDLVLDENGGIWFTDFGVERSEPVNPLPGVLYALVDGSAIHGAAWGTHQANGVGISPDGSRLYVAETQDANLWAWEVVAGGLLTEGGDVDQAHTAELLHRAEGLMFDSLAVDGDGWVCAASIGPGGGVTCVAPDHSATERVTAPDDVTTNLCFGGPEHRSAFLTLAATGRVGVLDTWPRPGGVLVA